jgi:short-chain fatty acids transporter
LGVAPHGTPPEVLGAWYDGIFKIFAFAFQMVLVLVTGYALSDRLRKVVAARLRVIQARDVDPREPWPDGRDCPQDQALSV